MYNLNSSNEQSKIFIAALTNTMYYAKKNNELSQILIKVREIYEGENGYSNSLNYMNNYCNLMKDNEYEHNNVIRLSK